MLPIVGVPATIHQGLAPYRDVFCRAEGFEHVERSVTGLLLSTKKTLQGIYDAQVWPGGAPPSRRAMHAAVFEAGWDADRLRPRHRALVAPEPQGRGREVLSLDWTYAHHERGPHSWGVKKRWDHVEGRMAHSQTVVTAVMANRALIDGREVVVQPPALHAEEEAYLDATAKESDAQMEAVRGRLLELLHHLLHRRAYRKRTAVALEVVTQREQAGHFPAAHDAFDHGLLTLELTRGIEGAGQHGVSELACSRHIPWQGQGRRVETVAAALRHGHPERCRPVRVRWRNGDTKPYWALTKVVRLKR
jgi:hypothetical protein